MYPENSAYPEEMAWPQKFVLQALEDKREGYYVELGAFHSSEGSNTNYLEKDYDWKGVSFEIVEEKHSEFVANRSNPCILGDARQFDYRKYFEENDFPKQIDFLQVDIDGGYTEQGDIIGNQYESLLGLIALPLNAYRFSVITFEHDANMYFRNRAMRDAQREILDSLGYRLVAKHTHEDWWVDPTVVKMPHYRKFFIFNAE